MPKKTKNLQLLEICSETVSSYSLSDGCYYCGGPATQWDHVVPRSRGGKSNIENLVPVCCHCNPSKGNKTLSEYRRYRNSKGLLSNFDTPDPKPIQVTRYVYEDWSCKFESADPNIEINGSEDFYNRFYYNDK